MPRESIKSKRKRAEDVVARLHERYQGAASALDYTSTFELLLAVMLSAQTTDAAVNKVTPELFRRWPKPYGLAAAPLEELEQILKSIGFYNTKARNAKKTAAILCEKHAGNVPSSMDELVELPGVGRKTANIVLNKGFGICEGIAVDTHVYRIASRLGFTKASTPAAAEADLLKLIDRQNWTYINEEWIHFGREICRARSALCDSCPLSDLCPQRACSHTKTPR